MATHSSVLAWRIPGTGVPGGLQSMGSLESDTTEATLPSDALSQHLPSYLGFFYLGRGVSLHGCSIKAQPLLLTLDELPLLTLNVE